MTMLEQTAEESTRNSWTWSRKRKGKGLTSRSRKQEV